MKDDRGFIKWQPFDSIVSGKDIIKSLMLEKSKIRKPLLSEEEKSLLEEQIIDAYYSNIPIIIHYYNNGFIKKIESKIKKIDQIYKLIYLNNNIKLFFNQILSIDTK